VTEEDRFILGLQHIRAGRRAEAEALCREMFAERANHSDALYLLGALAQLDGQQQPAMDYLIKAIAAGPVRPLFYCTYGQLLERSERVDEAIAAYENALAMSGNLAKIRNQLGHLLLKKGLHDRAIAQMRQAMAIEPNQAGLPFNLASIYVQLGDFKEAAALYRKAISLRPDYIDAIHNLGQVLSVTEGNDQAIAQYKEALSAAAQMSAAEKATPAHIQTVARTFISLGDALAGNGQFDQAIICYERAMRMAPNLFEEPNNYGACLYQVKRYEEAVAVTMADLRRHPEVCQLHHTLAGALNGVGRREEAKAAFRQAMTLTPVSEDLLILAQSMRIWAMFDEAIAGFRQLVAKGNHAWDQAAYWGLMETSMAKAIVAEASASERADALPKLPYLGDKVVLLRCDRAVRERLRRAGLHGGYAIDPIDGTEMWLAAQLAVRPDAAKLAEVIEQWLQWIRNEAAMAGSTAAVWMPDMPQAVAGAVRQAAGEDLIEITGESAEEIHARLTARAITPPDTEDKFFAVVSIRNGGLELLPHWLEYYTNLGVDEILLGIFDDLAGDAAAELEKCAGRWKFRRFVQHWKAATESETYCQRQTGCRLAGARPGTWILHTDLDELQQYPSPLKEIAASAAQMNTRAVFGRLVDRVAADGSLPPIRPHPSLWEQFPVECNMTGGILKSVPQKVMLARYSVLVKTGHHEAPLEPANPAIIGKVAHFKWHSGLLERMHWGLQQASASAEWKGDARRFLGWLDQHGGRINLADPALEARTVR
jgi:tetratricopeptide (TPR) repeat protein